MKQLWGGKKAKGKAKTCGLSHHPPPVLTTPKAVFPSPTPLILECGCASVPGKEYPLPALYLGLEKRRQKETQKPT